MKRQRLYAAYCPATREVKIGLSIEPAQRVRAHTKQGGHAVVLMAQIPGTPEMECAVHVRLADHRSPTHHGFHWSWEWFTDSPEVMLVVSQMMFMEHARQILPCARTQWLQNRMVRGLSTLRTSDTSAARTLRQMAEK